MHKIEKSLRPRPRLFAWNHMQEDYCINHLKIAPILW